MLMSVGPVVFDLVVNMHQYEIETEEDFARKDVVGTRKPFEHVGPGDEKLSIQGRLFPEKLGGAGAFDALVAMKETGSPQMVVRGDGKVMGWFVIRRVRASNQHLNAAGQPRYVEIEVSAERCDPPSAASHFSSLISLFG